MNYLTEPQERRLRQRIDELPARRTLPPIYPNPRLRGTTRLPSGQVLTAPTIPATAGGSIPQVRLWPFHVREAGLTSAAVIVSPRFTGPALLRRATLLFSGGAGNPMSGFQIYKSLDNAGTGNNLSTATIVSGTKLFDPLTLQDDQGGITALPSIGPTPNDRTGNPEFRDYELGIAITDQNFYIKIHILTNAAGAMILDGWLHILENLTPEQLANLP